MIPDKTIPIISNPKITATGGGNPLIKDVSKSSAIDELVKGLGKQGGSQTQVNEKDDNVATDEAKRKASEEEKRKTEIKRKREQALADADAVRKLEAKKRLGVKPNRMGQAGGEGNKNPSPDDAWLKDIHPIQVK
jgi:hypothetical protein